MNGINGPNLGQAVPMPTPAGHQAELNYIYGMVEELSRQLADNRRVTEDIVSGLGMVRSRARSQGQGNQDVISSAAEELSVDERNLDDLVSILSESLERTKFSRDANASLLTQYANALALMLRHLHDYKSRHAADVAVWHRSYRSQLDEARQENSRLREQIWEMQAHAAAANEQLRSFRKRYEEDEERWAARVDARAARQEVRFWKRMAMPEMEDDDSYWSDDDDLIDAAEKQRLNELERNAQLEQELQQERQQHQMGGESPDLDDGEGLDDDGGGGGLHPLRQQIQPQQQQLQQQHQLQLQLLQSQHQHGASVPITASDNTTSHWNEPALVKDDDEIEEEEEEEQSQQGRPPPPHQSQQQKESSQPIDVVGQALPPAPPSGTEPDDEQQQQQEQT